MSIEKEAFGQTSEGQPVHLYTLTNEQGVRVAVMDYGATIVSVDVPDRSGRMEDVLFGYDTFAEYEHESNPYFGACCGRYANRIAHACFSLGGVEYSLADNCEGNSLHGGLRGFNRKLWEAKEVDGALCMTLVSPDGEEGFPGTLKATLTYSLNNENELRLDYSATTDKETIVNLTSHGYFNLAGQGLIYDHVIRINADYYVEVDEASVPTGVLRPVAGTEMDLRIPTPIGRNIDAVQGQGYDHNYCINQPTEGELTLAASVVEPINGRTLECWTTQPGLQFYTANYLEGISGKGGQRYQPHSAFCLETQHYPDSPNQPQFPSVKLAPEEEYAHTCIYGFGVDS